MKHYFIQYRPFLLFLGKFFLAYLILTCIYQVYLTINLFKVDGITKMVAEHTVRVLQLFGEASFSESKITPALKLFYHKVYVARIVEGCNAISIIILFIAFVVAFSGRIKPTLFFIFGGSLIIYVLNVFRIALLSVLMYHYPAQEQLLHGIVFPLIIYGTVFILWIIWVNKFSKYAAKTDS